MSHYTATVSREGKWWMVHVPAIDGLTQARRLSEAERMARELIAVTTDVPIESVTVTVTIDRVGDVTGIPATLRHIDEERRTAAELERHAAAESTRLAKALADNDIPVRDIGAVLGISHQRAHQLINA